MSPNLSAITDARAFVLRNATVPTALAADAGLSAQADGLARADIRIEDGVIRAIAAPGQAGEAVSEVDLAGGVVFPGFVDMHTHLDKGHIWPRRPNPDGTHPSALAAVAADRQGRWRGDDVARRMDFALRCAYAHGTVALRTHIDSMPPQHAISWPVFAEMRERWRGRVDLQAAALVHADVILDHAAMADIIATIKPLGGLLGGSIAVHPRAREAVRELVRLAAEDELDLDLHIDESPDPASTALRFLAEAVIEMGFAGKVTAGHCCSIARQDADEADRTLDLVAEAGIAVVSLPMCNMYLQDRVPSAPGSNTAAGTPRWRGVTLLHEMAARGTPVAIASDNTRDPFYAYGDLDGFEVFREGTRIMHFDHPMGQWPAVVTRTPAAVLGVAAGELAVGRAADLVLFRGRSWSELLSRPQSDRMVLRAGRRIDAVLPDYRELDDLYAA